MNRGRSRQVSKTAIARKADTDRRIPDSEPSSSSSSSTSSSSMSSDYDYDDSPSPPQTLEDQVHVAYAQDNMHLAKILLLRLKGIEVDGDNDPRIAEVQDEDFDYCFAPYGTLVLDDNDQKALLERQRIEEKKMEERRRLERLRICEKKWTTEKRRMREERMTVLRQQEQQRAEAEADDRRRRKEQDDRAKQARARHSQARLFQLRPAPTPRPAHVLSYTSAPRRRPTDNDSDEQPRTFLYDYMTVPPNPQRRQPTSPLAPKPTRQSPIYDDSRAVSFAEVLAGMQGPLFPLTNEERSRKARSPATSKVRSRSRSKGPGKPSQSQVRRRKQSELFESLLSPPPSTDEDRRRSRKDKGKAVVRARGVCSGCRRSSSSSSSELSSPPSPASSSASSRPSSWLSFGSGASTSSIATTPSSSPSPRNSWFKSASSLPSPTSPTHRGSWLSTALVNPPSSLESRSTYEDRRCNCHLTPVNLCDTPLTFDSELWVRKTTRTQPYSTSLESLSRRRSRSSSHPGVVTALFSGVSQTVSASVTQLVGLAKGFQQAYVTAAMFSVAASCDGDRWEEREVAYEYDREKGVRVVKVVKSSGDVYQSGVKKTTRRTRRRPGYLASPKDVAKFLDLKTCSSCPLKGSDGDEQGAADREGCVHVRTSVVEVSGRKFSDIPLGSPYAPREGPPSTVLPNPLPYKLHFKPLPAPSRSPFRFNAFSALHTTYPNHDPVAEYTLRNACYSGVDPIRGIPWRLRSVGNPAFLRLRALQNVVWQKGLHWEGRSRETNMGGGRDRIVRIACEGVGRSGLSAA